MTQELEKAREALKVAEDVNNSEAVSGSAVVNNGEAVSGNTVANNVEAVSGNVIANNSEQAQANGKDQKYQILLMKKPLNLRMKNSLLTQHILSQ